MRSAVRNLLSGVFLCALFALGGCSQGESIPVEPVGLSLDAMPDPFFRTVAPLNDDLNLYDCVQLEDGRAWIVGEAGLILKRGSNGVWYREDSPNESNLLHVVADQDDRLWCVGADGTVLVHDAGGWSAEPTGTDQTLREIHVTADGIWVVGDGGTVLRRTAGVWAPVECPATTNLTGVWFDAGTGTLFVCGNMGAMLSYADGTWADESDGPWESLDLRSVVQPDGCNPVTVSREQYISFDMIQFTTMYERTAEGWQAMDIPQEIQESWINRLKAVGPDLWIEKAWNGVDRLRFETGAWILAENLDAEFFGSNMHVGVAAGRDRLLIDNYGGINWADAAGRVTPDPAGEMDGFGCLFRMADGSNGFVDDRGLFYWRDGRLQVMALDYDEDEPSNRYTEVVDGLSVDDFFVSGQDGLYHMVDGVAVLHLELEDRPRELELAVGADGDLFLSLYDGVWHLPPGASELVKVEELEPLTPEIRRTRSGRIVGWDWHYFCVFEDGEWTVEEMTMRLSPDFVWEVTDGVFGMYNDTFYVSNTASLHFWQQGTPGMTVVSSLVPGNRSLTISELRVGEQGLYACTREPSRLFRLDAGDPLSGRWDAITGVYVGYAGDFLPLDDGSLLVIDTRKDEILLYRDRYDD